jgi:hypothetical protein
VRQGLRRYVEAFWAFKQYREVEKEGLEGHRMARDMMAQLVRNLDGLSPLELHRGRPYDL